MPPKTASKPATEAPMRLISLRANNFMRLEAVRISIGERVTEITGENAQGKTSVLNAIASALGGKKSAPERPIRNGARSAEIILETNRYTITRRFTEGGSPSLHIAAGKDAPFNRPQELLDAVLGDNSFDPLAFTRMDPKKQTAVLLDAAGLRERFDAWQAQRDAIESTRLEIGRDRKRYEGEAKGEMVEAPAELVSVTDLAEQLRDAHTTNQLNAKDRAELQKARDLLAKLQEELAALEGRIKKGYEWCKANEIRIDELVDVDVSELETQIQNAEQTNEAVRHNERLAAAQKKFDDSNEQYRECTDSLQAIEAEKAAALEAAEFPVKGLAFGEEGLLLNGLPFTNAAMSEQIRASVAIGLAQNPTLRLMMVRDGSLLDRKGMAELERIADEMDAQILVERVGEHLEGVGVLIEAGRVKEASAG